MTKSQKMELARQLKGKLQEQRNKAHGFEVSTAKLFGDVLLTKPERVKSSLKDLCVLVDAVKSGDYTPVFETKMYKNHGSEYCHFLMFAKEVIA